MNKTSTVSLAVVGGCMMAASVFFVWNRPKTAGASVAVVVESTAAAKWTPLNEPIQPIGRDPTLDPKKIALGRTLFNDVRLSGDNSISCNSCHNLAAGGDDGRIFSVGIKGEEGDINSPTVFNSGLNFKQFWDGRANTLEDQLDGPTHNPKEMGSTWPEIVSKISADPEYTASFNRSYPDGVKQENIKDAIASFERSLTTPDSRFDNHLRGDPAALNDDEKAGYKLFKDLGCISCHQGMNVGGNMFQPFGVMADYFADRNGGTKADQGRFNVTGKPQDRHKFRVPGLRNVELTAPYFHDGSAKTLEDAVKVMAEYQLAQEVTEDEVRVIVAFLRSLTGKTDEP